MDMDMESPLVQRIDHMSHAHAVLEHSLNSKSKYAMRRDSPSCRLPPTLTPSHPPCSPCSSEASREPSPPTSPPPHRITTSIPSHNLGLLQRRKTHSYGTHEASRSPITSISTGTPAGYGRTSSTRRCTSSGVGPRRA
eukprot:6000656-Prymnesium_polylepis.2